MKIVVLDGYTLNPGDLSWERLEAIAPTTIYDRTPPDEIISRIGDADIIFTNKTPLTAETFATCPSIRFVCALATGYNVIDVDAAKARGIPVANVPAYGSAAVAQYVFSLLLHYTGHVAEHSKAVRSGAWGAQPDFCFWNRPLMELAGKTMGIIGYGRIGRSVANIAAAMGMKVLALASGPKPELETEHIKNATLDQLLAASDVISLHAPLFPSTEGIICKDSIAKMKDGVIIINTARGPLVNEADMAAALESGKVAYFAADVVSVEPIRDGNPLLGAKNCVVTPHIAWAPKDTRLRLMNIAADNLIAFIEGNPQNIVNS